MRYIRLNEENKIISIREGASIVEGEIQSNIGELGQIMQSDGTFTEPIKAIEEVKNDKIFELQQSYYAWFTTFQSSALGSLKTYPIDEEAQKNFNDYQNRLIADPNKDSFFFKTVEDGTLVNHTRAQFLQVLEDAEIFKVNQTIKLNDLVKQVNASTTKEEVEAIVW